MKAIKSWFVCLSVLALTSCAATKSSVSAPREFNIFLECSAIADSHYNNLTHGIDVQVTSNISDRSVIDASECISSVRQMIADSRINVDPSVKQFVLNEVSVYGRSLGINVGGSINTDYTLHINIRNFSVILGNLAKDRGVVEFDYTFTNPDNEILLRQTVYGRFVAPNNNTTFSYLLDRAFTEALKAINWDAIAGYLKIPKRADQQSLTQVKGDGNTALEHTIIRWNVESRPNGADVYWRIVSSTPDVKNTNSSFLGTTPYESTESFDIRGLSLENSGNVQVEIKCERPGYIPQTRRFNLGQVIEQKEISTKFNLVKEEE